MLNDGQTPRGRVVVDRTRLLLLTLRRQLRQARTKDGWWPLQFGSDLDVLTIERGQPVAVVHGTSEFLLFSERHVIVGGTGDGCRCDRGFRIPRRVERHVRAAERAGAICTVPAYARRPCRGRCFRAHRTVSICGSNVKLRFIIDSLTTITRRRNSLLRWLNVLLAMFFYFRPSFS